MKFTEITLPITKEEEEQLINDLKEVLHEQDHDNTVLFENPSYINSIVGINDDGQLVYSYELMIEWLMKQDGMEDETEAMEFIDYNTIRAIPYAGPLAPVVIQPIYGW